MRRALVAAVEVLVGAVVVAVLFGVVVAGVLAGAHALGEVVRPG